MAENTKKDSQRIDVIIQTQRMIEMMSRPQGATIKEICADLEINERTFYRRRDNLIAMDVPVESRGDPDGATSGKRYYIEKGYEQEIRLFLTTAEKMILRKLLYKKSYSSELEQNLVDKINKAILHDASDNNFYSSKIEFDSSEIFEDEKTFSTVALAVERKQPLKLWLYFNAEVKGLSEDDEYFKKIKDGNLDGEYFEPYTITQFNSKLYLIGQFNSKKLCAIRFNGIAGKTERITKMNFSMPEKYSAETLIEKIFYDEKPTTIKLSVNHKDSVIIRSRKWFDNIACDYYFDHQVITLETQMLEEAKEFFISLGSKVKILSPASLADAVQSEIKKTLENYTYTLPEPSYKNQLTLPFNFLGNAAGFGHTHTNFSLYPYYISWWRGILDTRKDNSYEKLFTLCDENKSPLKPLGLPLTGYKPASFGKYFMFANAIAYKDFIALEYPMETKITEESISHLEKIYESIKEDWFNTKPGESLSRGVLNKIIRAQSENKNEKEKNDVVAFINENYQKFSAMEPTILITGINFISEKIAAEIIERGTIFGHIPAVAVIFKNTVHEDNSSTIETFVYRKQN